MIILVPGKESSVLTEWLLNAFRFFFLFYREEKYSASDGLRNQVLLFEASNKVVKYFNLVTTKILVMLSVFYIVISNILLSVIIVDTSSSDRTQFKDIMSASKLVGNFSLCEGTIPIFD